MNRNMFKRTSAFVATVAVLSLSAVGCGGGGGGGVFSQPWYDVYGFYCGSGDPSPGCNFYSDGFKIIDVEDPYFFSSYQLELFILYPYYDSFGFLDFYSGWGWLSPSGILYDDFGFALNEDDEEDSRDMISDVAAAEKTLTEKAGKAFAARYSELSEAQGIEIASVLSAWKAGNLSRSRTDKELEGLTKSLYGLKDMKAAERALAAAKGGDISGLESLNREVASHWKTSPETSREILEGWYGAQLENLQADQE